jgi:hypothetical protein
MLRWIATAITIVSLSSVGSRTTKTIAYAPFGRLQVTVIQGEWEDWENKESTKIRIRHDDRTVWSGKFAVSRAIAAGVFRGLLVIAGAGARADGVEIEVHILGRSGDELHDVITPVSIDSQDAICLSTDGNRLVTAVQTDENCVMCWPKRFELQEMIWRDGRFVASKKWRTVHEYKSGTDAARNEGGGCAVKVLEETLFHD